MAAAASVFRCSPALLAGLPPPRVLAQPSLAVAAPRRRLPLLLRAAAKPASAAPEEKAEHRGRGITRPKPISPALQELLGVPEIPRTQALKQIWAYIKQHKLQDPENKKIIVCDEKLKQLFGGRERVGFLEISGLLNPHFIK
ncbi:hypothetical protein Taro_022525 [Colocasia esculenta]|uniref:DM2 domain-containing protein n=1 Tax=Colocasia esculenta TaxID=4460 RepID=A0A843V8K8_COLES|nr:hypothetical protein [Colocasia esculenta]